MKTHKTKQAALKAARDVLGADAIEGVDFNVTNTGAGWTHETIPPANEAAAVAQEKRVSASPTKEPAPAKKFKAHTGKVRPLKIPVPPAPSSPKGPKKTDILLKMLHSPGGASSKEMEEATGWQPHSVRGFLGTLRKNGVAVEANKLPKEPTIYRIAARAVEDVI